MVTSKLVVGQNVVCRRTRRMGQLLSITSARDVCTIRYSDTGEVTTTHSVNLRVAKWAEMRGNKPPTGKVPSISGEAPTRVVRRLRTDIPDQ
jgi:hypothetical protein